MTRTRILRRASERVLKGNSYWGFAGFCAMIMLSCAVAGLAMTTNGAKDVTELVVHDGQYQWKVYDREVFPDTTGAFHVRQPTVTDTGSLLFSLNNVNTEDPAKALFTVYMLWDGKIDLSDKSTITAVVNICWETGTAFAYRNPASPYDAVSDLTDLPFFRMHFLSVNGDSWAASDYWWSCDHGHFGTVSSFTITASLDALLGGWSDRDGVNCLDESELFTAGLSDVQEFGLSFGGDGRYANGVGVVSGSATFELVSFSIA